MAGEERTPISDKKLKTTLGWDTSTLEEYKRFADNKRRRELRAEIKDFTEGAISEGGIFVDEYNKALEKTYIVYRKAWEAACEEHGVTEREFPCPF